MLLGNDGQVGQDPDLEMAIQSARIGATIFSFNCASKIEISGLAIWSADEVTDKTNCDASSPDQAPDTKAGTDEVACSNRAPGKGWYL